MYLKRINGDIIGEGESLSVIIKENKYNLRDAYLGGANLEGTYLGGTDLRGAYLRDANLRGASLEGAYLGDARLEGADLGDSNLRNADLECTNLRGANLEGAYLRDAYLRGTNLRGAYLRGADRNGYKLKSEPIQILGFKYDVYIFDKHMEIGCEKHSFDDWEGFSDKRILEMDGREALEFWKDNSFTLLTLCTQKEK